MRNENNDTVTRSELAAILRDSGGPVGIAAWAESVAARLSPPPDPAAEQAATGWREKCEIKKNNGKEDQSYVEYATGGGLSWWLLRDGGWVEVGKAYNKITLTHFPTESAARLALSRAEEPWVEKVNPPRGPCTCNRNYVDDDEHAPDCGTQKPAPAPAAKFDAKAWAENMVPDGEPGTGCNGRGVIRAYDFPGDDYHWNPYGERKSSTPYARRYIAAALTAAHAAGDAEGYARGRAEGHTLGRIDERARLISLATAAPDAKAAALPPPAAGADHA